MDGSNLQECTEINTAERPITVKLVKKKTENVGTAQEGISQSLEEELGPVVHSRSDYIISGKLPPSYMETSMGTDEASSSWVLYCLQPACIRELGADKKYG